jgi:formate--tetrahydrofolate ligase
MEDINLHFTGDLHAITSANNLIAAAVDNHIYQGNELGINPDRITFKRCLDVNDRALRDKFNITAASEVMSVFCLASDLDDLRERLGNIIVGYNFNNDVVYVKDLKLEGSLVVLLKEAFEPNLVQTLENNPVLVHGGPFANIAHGCNSVVATKLGLKLCDYVVTEAGFGSDLGAEKFFDIKCRSASLKPDCVVLVCTIKALKYNGGVSKENIMIENIDAVRRGLPNLNVHIENMLKFNSNIIVCLNKYDTDSLEEIDIVRQCCNGYAIPFVISDSYNKGGIGSVVLAKEVCDMCEKENEFKFLYEEFNSIEEKISKLCMEIYHAGSIIYSDKAIQKIDEIKRLDLTNLSVCISKTQYSISDDSKKLGYPVGHEMFVRDVELYNGAGFVTVLMGDAIKMPGLPKVPNYEKIDLNEESKIIGLS